MRERGKTHQNDFLKMGEVISAKLKFSDLKFLEDNPRTIKEPRFKILSERIKADPTFFDNRPCLVNFIDGKYICYAGFQRAHAAAKVLKWKEIPCSVENDVPMDLMRRRAIYDNTHDGEWNSEVLSSWEYEVEEYRDMGVPEWVFGGDGEDEMQMPGNDELIGENKDKPPTMKITFPTPEDLQRCESEIQEVINRVCPKAYYSVSAGEI